MRKTRSAHCDTQQLVLATGLPCQFSYLSHQEDTILCTTSSATTLSTSTSTPASSSPTRLRFRRRRVGATAGHCPRELDHRFACGHHYMIFYDTQAHTERVHHTFEHLLIPITPGQSIADRPHSALPSRPRLPQHEISRKTLALQITAHPPNPINHSSDTLPSPTNPPIPAPNIARTAVTAHPQIPLIPVQSKVNRPPKRQNQQNHLVNPPTVC